MREPRLINTRLPCVHFLFTFPLLPGQWDGRPRSHWKGKTSSRFISPRYLKSLVSFVPSQISVDLTNLRKDTVYTLRYDIFKSSQMSSRKARGSITIRVRMEIDDERKLLLSCMEPPHDIYVNTKSRKEFRVVRWTTLGKYDMEQYSMKVMNSYIEELLSYQQVLYHVEDAIISLLMVSL
jgi:hypothetical protein